MSPVYPVSGYVELLNRVAVDIDVNLFQMRLTVIPGKSIWDGKRPLKVRPNAIGSTCMYSAVPTPTRLC